LGARSAKGRNSEEKSPEKTIGQRQEKKTGQFKGRIITTIEEEEGDRVQVELESTSRGRKRSK